MPHCEVCHCSGPYPKTISQHRTLAGAQKAFRDFAIEEEAREAAEK